MTQPVENIDSVYADEISVETDKDVELYIKLRDLKAAVSAEYDRKEATIVAEMEKIENRLMTFLNKTKQQGGNTKNGTFFKKVTTSSKVADRDEFLRFVRDEDMFNFIESRVNNTAVNEFIAANNRVPPGISVTQITKLSVQRSKTR